MRAMDRIGLGNPGIVAVARRDELHSMMRFLLKCPGRAILSLGICDPRFEWCGCKRFEGAI